jgi:ketosteroid isomerase-like protein
MSALHGTNAAEDTMRNPRGCGQFRALSPYVLRLIATAFALAFLAALMEGRQERTAKQSQASQDATAAIKELIAKYAEVVNVEPVDINLASQVWLNSPDVSLIFPLGEERGWEQVKQNFYENTMGALFFERKLTPGDITVHAYGGDSAWAEFSWRFVAKLRKNGSTVETRGRETQIYRKIGPDRWALIHVHYSAAPAASPSDAPAKP